LTWRGRSASPSDAVSALLETGCAGLFSVPQRVARRSSSSGPATTPAKLVWFVQSNFPGVQGARFFVKAGQTLT
jgi:hypothetical protein